MYILKLQNYKLFRLFVVYIIVSILILKNISNNVFFVHFHNVRRLIEEIISSWITRKKENTFAFFVGAEKVAEIFSILV